MKKKLICIIITIFFALPLLVEAKNIEETNSTDNDTISGKCPSTLKVKDDVPFDIFETALEDENFDFSRIEEYFSTISDEDTQKYIDAVVKAVNSVKTIDSNKYCSVYCTEENIFQFPGYSPITNSGNHFTWTIGNNSQSIASGLTAKLSGLKVCTTKVDLNKWIADYKETLEDIENDFNTYPIKINIQRTGGVSAKCPGYQEGGTKLSEFSPNPYCVEASGSYINSQKAAGSVIDGSFSYYAADIINADYAAPFQNMLNYTVSTKYLYYFSTSSSLSSTGIVNSTKVYNAIADQTSPGYVGFDDRESAYQTILESTKAVVEPGEVKNKICLYQLESVCCRWTQDYTGEGTPYSEPYPHGDNITFKWTKVSCEKECPYLGTAPSDCYHYKITYDKKKGKYITTKVTDSAIEKSPCVYQHYTRECSLNGEALSKSEIPSYVGYLGNTSGGGSSYCPSGYYMAGSYCYRSNTASLQNLLLKLARLIESLKGCSYLLQDFDYYLDTSMEAEYNKTSDSSDSPYKFNENLERVNEKLGESDQIAKKANITDSIFLKSSDGSGATYLFDQDKVPFYICNLGALLPQCNATYFYGLKNFWNYAYSKTFVATYEYILDKNTYRWVKMPSGVSTSTIPTGDYAKYGKFIDIGYGNYPVHFTTPGGNYEGLNVKITNAGYKNYLYNTYTQKITEYNNSLSDSYLSGTAENNEILYDCYYQIKEGSPYCPTEGCSTTATVDDDLGSVRIVYRPISLSSPFPSMSGTGRKTGANWCDKSNDNCLNNENNENVEKYILNNRNVSGSDVYNKEPMYKITLTPALIKQIRIYDEDTTYDDFNLYCNSGTVDKEKQGRECRSHFVVGGMDETGLPTLKDYFEESSTCGTDNDFYACDKLDNYER